MVCLPLGMPHFIKCCVKVLRRVALLPLAIALQDSLEALARLKEAVQEELDSLPTTSDDGLLLLLRPEPALPKDRLQLSEDELRRLGGQESDV